MPPRDRVDRLERLTNLVLVLLETGRPLTLREIADTVAGYPSGAEAARQAFERDKRALRELGIPLRMESVESEQQVGYRIHPDDYYLPELALDPGEEQALGFAIAAVQLGGAAGSDAVAKLGNPLRRMSLMGGAASFGPGLAPVAVLPSLPALGPIHEALRLRALVRFRYHGRERQVEPTGLAFRAGAWYLVGRDRAAEGGPARRTFRVDRLESFPSVGEAGAFEVPIGGDLRDEIRLLPWSPEEGSEVPLADVVVDARQAGVVATQVPRAAISSSAPDGSLRLRLAVGDVGAFVSWVVGLGDTAVVEGPEELRAAVVERLRALAHPGDVVAHVAPDERAASPSVGSGTGRSRSRRAPAEPRRQAPATGSARLANAVMAGERLRRLLAILVHLARVGEAELAEVAERFAIAEDELVDELELAACCGVPPYSPDELIELYVDGDRVVANRLREFERPQRLTPEEGFVLAAAARALLAVPGADEEGALRSALAKLEGALGAARLALDIEQPAHLAALQQAARERERVEIEYFSSSATAPSLRTVDPYQVVLRESSWYLDGWCHLAGGLRRFQVDRVQSMKPLGEHFDEPVDLADELQRPGAYLGGADAVAASIAFPRGSELAVEQVAAGRMAELDDGSGRLTATVLVSDAEGWFGRLLLRLGPGTEVLSPEELKDAAVRAAERALRRYGIDSPAPSSRRRGSGGRESSAPGDE